MAKITKQSQYDERMKELGLKKICVWAKKVDHAKIKKTAKLSRNRTIKKVLDNE